MLEKSLSNDRLVFFHMHTLLFRHHSRITTIGGGAEGALAPAMTGLGAPCTLGPPTLTPVDRNKTYCFHELVLNLPAPLDIQ